MIDIKKLKAINIVKNKKLDRIKEKNNLIDLFNEQLKILDSLKDYYKNCQTLILNLDEAYKLAEVIWLIPKQKDNNYPICKETQHFEQFIDFRIKYINKALDILKLSESLDRLIKEFPNKITLQLCNDLNKLDRKEQYKDIEHLFLGVTNHKNKLKQSIE